MKTPERNDDPKASATLVVAIVGAVLVFVIIVALQAFFYRSEESERARKVYAEVPEELAALRARQQEQLHRYRWVDQARGIAGIPIERAMELVVKEEEGNRQESRPTPRSTQAPPHGQAAEGGSP